MNEPLMSSIKAQLKSMAKQEGLSFRELWHNLVLERFLVRLSQSRNRSNLIMKGGALLARLLSSNRETRDLDFLVQGVDNDLASLTDIIDDVCTAAASDGLQFRRLRLRSLQHPRMPYPGAEVLLLAHFGGTRTHLQIDLGVGDVVKPVEHQIDLLRTKKGALFESNIAVHGYPLEFIFSEKLETAVSLGSINTRMKDFHDLFLLTTSCIGLQPRLVAQALALTFSHRRTPLESPPLAFTDEQTIRLQSNWSAYYRSQRQSNKDFISDNFQEIVRKINSWLVFDLPTNDKGRPYGK